MSARVKQAESLFVAPPEELDAVRRLMFDALVYRGLSRQDAEDAVQDVLEAIIRHPEGFAARLASVDEHGAYFINAALAAYGDRLRNERRRRRREMLHHQRVLEDWSGPSVGRARPRPNEILDLVAAAPLTALQRRYLRAVLVNHSSIAEIATSTGTTPTAVRAVLRRATAIIRHHRLPAVA